MSALGSILPWFISLSVFLLTFVIVTLHRRRKYFESLGIPYLGSGAHRMFRLITGALNMAEMEQEIHKQAVATGAPIVGMTDMSGKAAFYITDLDLAKQILVKDFDHFTNRRPIQTKGSKGWFSKVLFFMEDDQWKGFRAKMSPAFTTGRIRKMFQIFKRSSESLEKYIKRQMNGNSVELDFTQIFSKYNMDVIVKSAFGIDAETWEVEPGQHSTFEKMGHRFGFDFSGKMLFKLLLMSGAPKLAEWLGVDMLDGEAASYYAKVLREVIKIRRQTGERCEDFLQLMLDAQEGTLKADEEAIKVMMGNNEANEVYSTTEKYQNSIKLEDDDIVANGMLFLMAGFGPVQSTLLVALHTMAMKMEIQKRIYEEVKMVMERHGGQLTYEAISEMTYVDMVVNETTRYLPLAGRLERVCGKAYTIPGTNTKIYKGALMLIPVPGFHKDSRFYTKPEDFLPERFSAEASASRPHLAFMPFGYGPRNCLGMRFSIIKIKVAICQLANAFEFTPCSKTQAVMNFGNSLVKPKGGLWLKVTKRQN